MRINIQVDLDVLVLNQLAGAGNGILDDFFKIQRCHRPGNLGGFDLFIIQHLADQADQPIAFFDDDAGKFFYLVRIDVWICMKDFREGAHRGKRCAQLVGDRGYKIILEAVQFLQLRIGRFEFGRGIFQFTAVGDHLPGFVQDVQYFFDSQGFFFDNRRYHDPGRGGSNCPG